jgi:hypothetical protein
LQKTPSSTTGPDNAPEGTVYMFIETSNPKVQGDYAMLASPTLTGNYLHVIIFNFKYNSLLYFQTLINSIRNLNRLIKR